jgi:hypothetical protein
MTIKRDLKRHIRERQAKTGESYLTARGHVLAQRPGDPIPVVEPIDATEAAAQLGLRCRVLIFPKLVARFEIRALLGRVRDAILVCDSDLLRDLAIHGQSKPMPLRWLADRVATRRYRERVRAGIGGVGHGGYSLALHADGVAVMCSAWHFHITRPAALVLTMVDETGAELWGQDP